MIKINLATSLCRHEFVSAGSLQHLAKPSTFLAAFACITLLFPCSDLDQKCCRADDGVRIWEFSPYEVEIWYSFGEDVAVDETTEDLIISQLDAELKRTFRAAWKTTTAELPADRAAIVASNFDQFTLQDLARNELVLVASLKHPETKTVRTMEAAIGNLNSIAATEPIVGQLRAAVARNNQGEDSLGARLLSKCSADSGSTKEIVDQLVAGEIPCGLIPRTEAQAIEDGVRVLLTTLPWQTDGVLRSKDKIMFLHFGSAGDAITMKARELDCPMQYMGPTMKAETSDWAYAARPAAAIITKAFAPIARVEDASSTSAKLRQRAGGLIVHDDNPAEIRVGDLMQPIVRRDDRNGIPTLLQPLSFTFAAITDSDRVRLDANVYTYSNGPGLMGRRNRRTRRMLLRVRPVVEDTDLRVVLRGSGTPQAGCFVYTKDLITDEFTLLGRTDWRGQFNIPVGAPDSFLRAEEKKKRLIAKREALAKAEDEQETAGSEDGAEDAEGESPEVESDEGSSDVDPDAIQLNQPLLKLYVKNGETSLASLPFVPGLRSVEIAELRDDRRRLKAEAFVKGFREKIIDIIGLRNLFAARIKLELKAGKVEEASRTLMKMREQPTYNDMADQLEEIQRIMLDETDGAVTLSEKNRIDRMFQVTRNLLQKYLQDNLLRDSEVAVKEAGGSVPTDDS
ncbi:MAG: hypothetical protein AAGG44_09650 [Planctomycetota bacterium]